MSEYWKVEVNGETHTDGLTYEEAEVLAFDLNNLFPENNYIPMPSYSYEELQGNPRFTPRGVADGWEDLFPDRDY